MPAQCVHRLLHLGAASVEQAPFLGGEGPHAGIGARRRRKGQPRPCRLQFLYLRIFGIGPVCCRQQPLQPDLGLRSAHTTRSYVMASSVRPCTATTAARSQPSSSRTIFASSSSEKAVEQGCLQLRQVTAGQRLAAWG